MKEEYAKQIVNRYMKQIYSFVRKRVSNEQDVADLTQDICLNIYKSLSVNEIYSVEPFIWTVAKHVLANYYRGKQKSCNNVSADEEMKEYKDMGKGPLEQIIDRENYEKIRSEIAYLSKMQRTVIIMYYYDEKKQTEIADILGIPLGTVKWHLNTAKTELKKGMEKMRNISDLKFNPVEFGMVSLSGSSGELGEARNFLRSALSQNIIYVIRNKPHTIEEIADAIGVSPVYVESELEYLCEYSIAIKDKDKYISNIIVEDSDGESIKKHRELYTEVSALIANELYDRIIDGGYLNHEDISGADNNYIMWSLVFYLLSEAESDYFKEDITFDEVAVLRADGGKNIITASVKNKEGDDYSRETGINKQYGPCWNESDHVKLWVMDGEWTEKRVDGYYGGPNIARDLSLLYRFYRGEKLHTEDYAYLLSKHYIKKTEEGFDYDIVVLKDGELKKKLFEITREIKNKYMSEIDGELKEYKKWIIERGEVPKHLIKQQEFCMQYLFYSDGWFMLYARKALESSGRLKPVSKKMRAGVTEILIIR